MNMSNGSLFMGILIGIWLNRRNFADLKAAMNRLFSEVNRPASTASMTTSRCSTTSPAGWTAGSTRSKLAFRRTHAESVRTSNQA